MVQPNSKPPLRIEILFDLELQYKKCSMEMSFLGGPDFVRPMALIHHLGLVELGPPAFSLTVVNFNRS